MFKVIVCGSRSFNDYGLLKSRLDRILSLKSDVEIVSGKARGADCLGEKYASKHDLPLTQFPALWDKYGRSAGFRRNHSMADYSDACVAFWDGKSRGTAHMIDLCREKGLPVRVIRF